MNTKLFGEHVVGLREVHETPVSGLRAAFWGYDALFESTVFDGVFVNAKLVGQLFAGACQIDEVPIDVEPHRAARAPAAAPTPKPAMINAITSGSSRPEVTGSGGGGGWTS
jgi:hypothetical protein